MLPNKEIAMTRALTLEEKLKKSPVDLESANKILADGFDGKRSWKLGLVKYINSV